MNVLLSSFLCLALLLPSNGMDAQPDVDPPGKPCEGNKDTQSPDVLCALGGAQGTPIKGKLAIEMIGEPKAEECPLFTDSRPPASKCVAFHLRATVTNQGTERLELWNPGVAGLMLVPVGTSPRSIVLATGNACRILTGQEKPNKDSLVTVEPGQSRSFEIVDVVHPTWPLTFPASGDYTLRLRLSRTPKLPANKPAQGVSFEEHCRKQLISPRTWNPGLMSNSIPVHLPDVPR